MMLEYDLLKKEILELEKKYKFLTHIRITIKKVGYKPSKNFKKVTHKVPMLSLGNAFSENDLINFEKKILNYINDLKL
jgi:DNA ligase (NAD+)